MLVFWTLCTLLIGDGWAKHLDRCEFAHFLETKHALKREDINVWVCIAQAESNLNTEAINLFNTDFSRDYGLFQINSKYWCADDIEGANICKMQCADLLDENIADDVECAITIYRETESFQGEGKGFHAWVYYNSTCQHAQLKGSLDDCWTV